MSGKSGNDSGLRPILIAGPTASGKSALAVNIASRHGGVIINADSMQVYSGLRILTARPGPEEMGGIEHHLYGHVPPSQNYSAGRWLEDVKCELSRLARINQRPIIIGGTGLYFKLLLAGLSPAPPIEPGTREKWRSLAEASPAALHPALAKLDPPMAARLHPNDRQRLARALEVIESTGKSLLYWQSLPGQPLVNNEEAIRLLVNPPREKLYPRINARFEQMMEAGGLEEARKLLALKLSPALPAMRAIGVRPLIAHLSGEISLDEAAELARQETRRYAKRQKTWIRSNMIAWKSVNEQDMQSSSHKPFSFI